MANDSLDVLEALVPTAKLATQTLTRGADTVHQEEMVIGDGVTNGRIASVTAASALKVDNSAVVQPVSDNGSAITVDALDLDIRNLATGQDTVDARLRDAANATFIDPVIKTQLPAALVSGRLSVDASGVAVPVTDNAGSLTVDAPVGTPAFVRLSDGAAALIGQKVMASAIPVVISNDQSTVNVAIAASSVLFRGRASTFRTPGRAGTAGQKIMSLHNATGSSVTVKVKKVFIDLAQTVIKAVTVPPPMVRLWKVTVLPTNGTALTKNKIGGSSSSNASVTVLGDASADGTGSGTTLTATLPAGTILTQEFAARLITAAGYEVADRLEFLGDDTEITLAALEGVVVFLDYTAAGQNPTTDMWIASIEWTEE